MTADTWANGNIPAANGEEWFVFTASAAKQYFHTKFGTLTGLTIQVYDSANTAIGSGKTLTGSTLFTSLNVTVGQKYYVKARPSTSTGRGTYKMAFNETLVPPEAGVTTLTAGAWVNGNIAAAGGEQWFTFTASAAAHYLHFEYGSLTDLYVQVYDSAAGNTVGSEARLSAGGTGFITRSVTSGGKYYVRIRPYSGSGSGTYRIGLTEYSSPPR